MKRTAEAFLLILLLFAAGYMARDLRGAEVEPGVKEPESIRQENIISLYDVPAVNGRSRSGIAVRSFEEGLELTASENGSGPALRRERLWLDDIALVELFRDDGQKKPLLLFLHGLGQDKDSSLTAAEAYAQAGYHVVCMDAFHQGERSPVAAYCDFWAVVLITVADIDHVLDYYEEEGLTEPGVFVLAGFSMGAVEAWSYAILGRREPTALLSFCGVGETNGWQDWVRELLNSMWLKSWDGLAWAFPELQSEEYTADKSRVMDSLDATANPEAFARLPVFCAMGTEDMYFSSERTAEMLESLGSESICFCSYEGEGHSVSPAMISDSLLFLQARVESLTF